MVVKRKSTRQALHVQSDFQDVVERVISRGGNPAIEIEQQRTDTKANTEKEARFTLRLPISLVQKIDEARKLRAGIVSRNQWILEIIAKAAE